MISTPDPRAALVAREFDALNQLMDCSLSGDDITSDMPKELIEAKLLRFLSCAEQAIPKIEWLLINAGDILSPDQRSRLSLYRGQLCEMLALRAD